MFLSVFPFQLGCDRSIPDDAPDEVREVAYLSRVVDGDTIQTYDGRMIRLIGIDAPEQSGPYTTREPGAKQAEEFVHSFFSSSKTLYLSFDHQKYDDHGRLLAYVFRGGDYKMLNAALIRKGWAKAYRKYRYKRKTRFIDAEKDARREERGIWK